MLSHQNFLVASALRAHPADGNGVVVWVACTIVAILALPISATSRFKRMYWRW